MAKRLFLIICLMVALVGTLNVARGSNFEVAKWGYSDALRLERIEKPRQVTMMSLDMRPQLMPKRAAGPTMTKIQETPKTNMAVDAISILGQTIPIVEVSSTAVDSGDHINKYGAKFLYGHNTAGVLGSLSGINVGDNFRLTIGGVAHDYLVAEVVIYEKVSAKQVGLNGIVYNMRTIVDGMGRYDMVLMTCHGTSYGSGDASHRLVVYAYAI